MSDSLSSRSGTATYQVRGIRSAGGWLLAVCAVLLAAGCGGSRTSSRTEVPGFQAADRGATVKVPARTARYPLTVAYRGPHSLRGRVTLRAQIRHGTRVVAATFMLAGKPLGTVTQPPWALDVDAAVLPGGPASLSVVAVDRLGRRSVSPVVNVRVLAGGESLLHASPDRGLTRAIRALARGSATVKLAPGRYHVGEIALGPGARLLGSGPQTILTPRSGKNDVAMLSTRGSGVRISDLAVEGDGQVDDAVSIGDGSTDVRVQRLEVSGVRMNGVAVRGAHRNVSIQDSAMIGGGVAGNAGILDQGSVNSRDTSVVRTRITGFVGYGVLFAQRFYGLRSAAIHNLALDNTISDVIDPHRHDGTDAGGIWTGGVGAAVIGNQISHTGTDGIETVGSSTHDTIVANDVQDTPVAIYIEHSTNLSLIEFNRAWNVVGGINVEWRHSGGGSNSNVYAYNDISAAEAGVFVDVQEDDNAIVGNVFGSAHGTPVILQGSSHNTVRGNLGCAGGSAPFVVERAALSQTGALARSSDNRLVDNERTRPCRPA
jgi:Periplasmic copper-binding protein (NosD)